MIDIENTQHLTDYMQENGFVDGVEELSLEPLKGGVSCKVIRATNAKMDIVIKQAREKLMVSEDWFSDVSRILIERDCLQAYNRIVPEIVPDLVFSDDDNYLYAMSAAPHNAVMWKTELMAGRIRPAIAATLGKALATLHSASVHDSDIQKRFADTTFFEELRLAPYLETSRDRNPAVVAELTQLIAFLRDERTVLVHGDFSPKNILVWDDDMMLLDFEVAHIGNPAFDLGFMMTHFLLKALIFPNHRSAFVGLIDTFLDNYFEAVADPDGKVFRQTVKALGGIVLARVDGKSPVEYIHDDAIRTQVRAIAYRLLQDPEVDRHDFTSFLQQTLTEFA